MAKTVYKKLQPSKSKQEQFRYSKIATASVLVVAAALVIAYFINGTDDIPGKLEIGENLLTSKNIEEALIFFNGLVKTYPLNPLVRLGLGRVLERKAEKEKSNGILKRAVAQLEIAMALPYVDDNLFREIALFKRERQAFLGLQFDAAETMESLHERFPEDLYILEELGAAHLNNDAEASSVAAARKAFEKILSIEEGHGIALANLGIIAESHERNSKKAAELLVRALESNDTRVIDSKYFYYAADSLTRIHKKEEANVILKQGADLGVFLSEKQRPRFHIDRLTGKPWWSTEDFPKRYQEFFKSMVDNWQVVRDEGLAQIDSESGLFKDERENLRETGEWKQFVLYDRGQRRAKACELAPKTCSLIAVFNDAHCVHGQVKYSLLFPDTHVWPHCGPTNCRLRPHLGLKIPGGAAITVAGETNTWKEGKFIVIDDSFEHEVWHNGTEPRLILIIDVWHPDLTPEEKSTLKPVF